MTERPEFPAPPKPPGERRKRRAVDAPRLTLALIVGGAAGAFMFGLLVTYARFAPAPALALLAALVGLAAGALVARAFEGRARAPLRSAVAEQIVLSLAYRRGGRVTPADLARHAPLGEEEARAAIARLLASGRLREDGEGYRAP